MCGSRALAWILSQTINFLSLAPNFFGAHIFAGALDLIIPTIKGSANTSINEDQARGADLWFLTGRGSAWVICGGLIWRRESERFLEVTEFLHHQYLFHNCNAISYKSSGYRLPFQFPSQNIGITFWSTSLPDVNLSFPKVLFLALRKPIWSGISIVIASRELAQEWRQSMHVKVVNCKRNKETLTLSSFPACS